jgi:hypothetical protein
LESSTISILKLVLGAALKLTSPRNKGFRFNIKRRRLEAWDRGQVEVMVEARLKIGRRRLE